MKTPYTRRIAKEIEQSGVITDKDREILPGVHWCEDFDFMLVWDGTPEGDACTCKCRLTE